MHLYRWLIAAIIFILFTTYPVRAQNDTNDSTFIPNPFLRDDIRTPPKPKIPPKATPKEVTKSGKTFNPHPVNHAKVSLDHLTFDFGSIAADATITHNFPIGNTGIDSLHIDRIRPS